MLHSRIIVFFFILFSFFGCIIKTESTVKIRDLKLTDLTNTDDSSKISGKKEIDTTTFYPVNSKDTLHSIYFNAAQFLWKNYVPKSGQAKTQQGEMIRIIERLDHEIRGNGKGNWDEQFTLLANTLRDSLISSGVFPEEIEREIKNDIAELQKDDEVYIDDDIYNRLTRRIVEWYWRHKEPIKHINNPKLQR